MQLNARAYTVLTMIAIFAMAAIAAYQVAWPKAKPPLTELQMKQGKAQLDTNIAVMQKQLDDAKAYVNKYVWNASMDSVTGHALASVTTSAHSHQVQLVGFRPQKTGTVQGLVIAPYLVLLTGSFSKVDAVLEDLEQPSNKLAIEMVQFAAADESSDTVNATLTVVAYQNPPTEAATSATTKTK